MIGEKGKEREKSGMYEFVKALVKFILIVAGVLLALILGFIAVLFWALKG